MLRQLPLLGPMPRLSTRRLAVVLVAVSVFAFCLVSALTAGLPTGPSLSTAERKTTAERTSTAGSRIPHDAAKSPQQRPITPSPKPLPRQKDDSYGNSVWLSQKELTESLSKEITLDDERVVLPELKPRRSIYCYYDPLEKLGAGENDTDTELLLMWRRSWWARGFKPFILGPDEAKSNPLYARLESVQAGAELKRDLLRWLAWDTTDGGLLSQPVLFPMGADSEFLPALRDREYSTLTRAGDLASGLFWGSKENIRSAVQKAMGSTDASSATTLLDLVGASSITAEELPPVLAYYNTTVIEKKYPKLALEKNKYRFGTLRNQLINAHMQGAWQNSHHAGIDILSPFPQHANALLTNATDLANALASCPPTPLAGSCPPNLPKCGPCGATTPLVIRTPKRFMKHEDVFTIGMVPHPWTRTVLADMATGFNATRVRQSDRDPWIATVCQSMFAHRSKYQQVLQYKKDITGDMSETRSLWITAEDPFPTELDWFFGFAIPKVIADDGRSESPVPSDHINDPDRPDLAYGKKTVDEVMEEELAILNAAKKVIALPRATTETRRRASLEAWNMADTEAWRFTRATHDRRTLERKQWEDASKYTKDQRLISDAGWAAGMVIRKNSRKQDQQKAKARD